MVYEVDRLIQVHAGDARPVQGALMVHEVGVDAAHEIRDGRPHAPLLIQHRANRPVVEHALEQGQTQVVVLGQLRMRTTGLQLPMVTCWETQTQGRAPFE